MFIRVATRVLLCLKKPGANIRKERVAVGQQGVDCVRPSAAWLIRQKRWWRSAVDHLEQSGAQHRVRTVLTLAHYQDWPIHQLDVKNAFLHGSLKRRTVLSPLDLLILHFLGMSVGSTSPSMV